MELGTLIFVLLFGGSALFVLLYILYVFVKTAEMTIYDHGKNFP